MERKSKAVAAEIGTTARLHSINVSNDGGPERAVSLYSIELIRALQAQGHPVEAGSLGENFTLAGVAWQRMAPGASLIVGDVVLELTAYAAPCSNLLPCFRDRRFVRVSQKAHPGWSRLYARVAREGTVTVGDAVLLVI